MNPQDSKQLVIAAWQAFASRDKERIAALFSDDAEWLAPVGNATALAMGGVSRAAQTREVTSRVVFPQRLGAQGHCHYARRDRLRRLEPHHRPREASDPSLR